VDVVFSKRGECVGFRAFLLRSVGEFRVDQAFNVFLEAASGDTEFVGKFGDLFVPVELEKDA